MQHSDRMGPRGTGFFCVCSKFLPRLQRMNADHFSRPWHVGNIGRYVGCPTIKTIGSFNGTSAGLGCSSPSLASIGVERGTCAL